MPPHVKICCISSLEEAHLAISFGAYAIGLVGPMPSGPGIISNELIGEISNSIPTSIKSFLLTSETSSEGIVAHHKLVNTNTIQIVDEISEGSYQAIRRSSPKASLVQVIHVIDEKSIDQAQKAAEQVDAILLDSGNPNLDIKELGGTGRTHNWSLSRKIVERIEKPVYLAGGLNAQNVRRAIEEVSPFGLDLCSGVRSNGKLDERKLEAFFNEVNNS